MVHLDRIREEIRVLNIKDETLLSYRVYENFSKRIQHFNTIKMGGYPDRNKLTEEELEEQSYLNSYFENLKDIFPQIETKWRRRYV
jgi:hypothetical protein